MGELGLRTSRAHLTSEGIVVSHTSREPGSNTDESSLSTGANQSAFVQAKGRWVVSSRRLVSQSNRNVTAKFLSSFLFLFLGFADARIFFSRPCSFRPTVVRTVSKSVRITRIFLFGEGGGVNLLGFKCLGNWTEGRGT